MNKSLHSLAYLVLIAIIVLLCLKSCTEATEKQHLIEDVNTLNNEIVKQISSNGTETAKTETMQAKYEDIIKVKDKRIAELELNKHTETATSIQIVTRDTGSTKTIVKYIANDSLPTYLTEWCDTNSCGTITANKDSVHREIKVFNHILVKQEWQRLKWYKSRQLMTEVSNSNPYTNTISIVSYKKQPKQRKYIVIGALFVGFALGVLSR